MKATFTGLALTLMLASPLALGAQEEPGFAGPAILQLDELQMEHYTPKHVRAAHLLPFLQNSVGRQYYVAERGGRLGDPIVSVARLGDSIVLYDTAKNVARLKETLLRVDVQNSTEAGENRVTKHYSLRHLAVQDASAALRPLDRGNGNYTVVEERRQVILNDAPEHVRRMEALLQALDVPEDQFQIRLLLVRGEPGSGSGSGVPEELAKELAEILPAFRFEALAFSMLQSAANPNRMVNLGMQDPDGVAYDLKFRPVAYDARTGDLTVHDCTLHKGASQLTATDGRGVLVGQQQLFNTNTIFRGGEYTVLGAAGAEPVFVVVRMKPISTGR